jgi:hypothetical protein
MAVPAVYLTAGLFVGEWAYLNTGVDALAQEP